MELALGAIQASLFPKLRNLLTEEYIKQKGLTKDIKDLSMELVVIHAVLVDVSRLPLNQLTEVDKVWARQVRELSYDMEDAVDDFILRIESGTATDANAFKKIFRKAAAVLKNVKNRHQISNKVKDIKELSDKLDKLHKKYTKSGIGANRAATTGIDPRVINLYKKESDLVGIEETKDRVIRMLMGNRDHDHATEQSLLKIVSIVGVGGLGKTTLAKTVHDMLKKEFDCCAFVSVGRTPDLARIFEKILGELDQKYKNRDGMARWDSQQFLEELQKYLQHKRYFIVIDDIWDKESWKVIKHALEDNSCGSRIIMTTRNFEVVTKVEEVHRLKPLSYDNSKKLFYKRIQSEEGEIIDDLLAEVSSNIIHKCGGVPLAIISIASLLVDKPCEDWEKVYDSIGYGSEDNTMKILSYSYNDLPYYLKPCLLHISIYPEDFIFDTNSMIWVWIGEGFVYHENKGEDNLFELGERYFKELVNRSMIQPLEDKFVQFAQWFHVHDIVFDLICELSRDENYATILGSREQQASSSSSRRYKKTSMRHLDSKVRRLVVQNHHSQHLPEETMDMPEVLRSLNIIDSEIGTMSPLDSFRVCRVLYIHDSNVPIHLKHMGRLLHLKYLEIQKTHVAELPKEIGHLKSLQALVLIDIGLHELPPAVCSLTQLMCLIVEGFERFPADRIGNLISLEELRLKSIADPTAAKDLVVELGKLTRLRMVTITFSEELEESLQKALVQSLCNMQELQELALHSRTSFEPGATAWEGWVPPKKLRRLLITGIIFARPPGWIKSYHLPLMYFLHLVVYVVEVQDLDNLVRLPKLSYLNLDAWSWPPAYTVGTDGFKNMRFCFVGTALKFHEGCMPRLEQLQFGVNAGHGSFEIHGVTSKQIRTEDAIVNLDFGLDNLLSLEQLTFIVKCLGASVTEVEEVEAMIRGKAKGHPNRPTIILDRVFEDQMLSNEDQEVQQYIEELLIGVLEWKDKPADIFNNHLRSYGRLQKAVISIDCVGASLGEVEKVEEALRHAADVHPDHPTIQLIRINTELGAHDDGQHKSLSKLKLRD